MNTKAPLLALMLLALSAPAASAAPGFGGAHTTVGTVPARYASDRPLVAINVHGASVVAWENFGPLVVRRGDAAGHYGPATTVGQASFGAHVAISDDGTVVVSYPVRIPLHGTHGEVVVARPGHSFGSPQRLPSVPQIVATGGRIVAIWGHAFAAANGIIRYAIAGSNGHFGGARTMAGPGTSSFQPISVVTDAAGDVVVGYPSVGGVATASLAPGASVFGTPQVTPSYGAGGRLSSGPGGVALSWQTLGGGPLGSADGQPRVAMFASDAQLGGPLAAPDYVLTHKTYEGPAVALPATGGALMAWVQGYSYFEIPKSGELDVAQEQPDGSLSALTQVTKPGTISRFPDAAATTNAAIVVWAQGPQDRDERAMYAVRLAGGALSAPRTLATKTLEGASLAASGNHAIVAWSTRDGHVHVAPFSSR